jgi:hypothetical protein
MQLCIKVDTFLAGITDLYAEKQGGWIFLVH